MVPIATVSELLLQASLCKEATLLAIRRRLDRTGWRPLKPLIDPGESAFDRVVRNCVGGRTRGGPDSVGGPSCVEITGVAIADCPFKLGDEEA